jgi:choline dehydrogenase-like flavoprotein
VILDLSEAAAPARFEAEVAVVGSGPGGTVTALELARQGIDVVLIESGLIKPDAFAQSLADTASRDEDRHAPAKYTTRRQIGGSSNIWAGRCVPYDPVDFEARPFASSTRWPITFDDVQPYYGRACTWMVCGRPAFSLDELPHLPPEMVPGLHDGNGVTVSTLERWSLPTNFGTVYLEDLREAQHLRVLTGLTATQVVCERGQGDAQFLECRTQKGARIEVHAKQYVLACGGLDTTRLLLQSPGPRGAALGDESGHLGHWYMAHLEGSIAQVAFSADPKKTIQGYERDVDGTWVRRRFGFTEQFQREHRLPNLVGWIANPEPPDASHNDAVLSFTYLSLKSPIGKYLAPEAIRRTLLGQRVPGAPYGQSDISPVRDHLKNVLRHPFKTAGFAFAFGSQRFLAKGRKPPGFYVSRPDNVYTFAYHAEHLPTYDSKVTLSSKTDAVGMRRLDVDIRFPAENIDGVVRAHRFWDEHLRKSDVGEMRYVDGDLHAAVDERSGGGFHQVGTTRMAADPADGVVDADLKVHGVDNVYVASSSVFVTSGQANSTFMIVVLAVRLADKLAKLLRP